MIQVHTLSLGTMDNLLYIIGDSITKQATVIDPAWDANAIQSVLDQQGYELTFILLTHGHFDHTNALEPLLNGRSLPVYLSNQELDDLTPTVSSLVLTEDNFKIPFGERSIQCIQTPGHTPGGQCFILDQHLFTGDSLFINGCGRCDLQGSDPVAMWQSLLRLKELPDDLIVYPGHDYADNPTSTLGHEKEHNRFLTCESEEVFIRKRMG